MRKRAAVIAAIGLALVLAAWFYHSYRVQTSRDAVAALIRDTGERLRTSWPRDAAEAGVDVDVHSRAVESHVLRLREMKTSSVRELADAADDYLVTAREILRRLSAIRSARARVVKDMDILATHLRSDRGQATWPREAVRLKSVVDAALRDYRIASESYASLLRSLPASQARVARYLDPAAIIDDRTIGESAARALDALARTDENIRQLTRLDAYRGGRAITRR
jgi:hypothetical protein